MGKLYPVFYLGGGGNVGSGQQYFSFISARDHARAIVHTLETPSLETLLSEVERIQPSELLITEDSWLEPHLSHYKGLRKRPEWEFDIELAERMLTQQLGTKDLQKMNHMLPSMV